VGSDFKAAKPWDLFDPRIGRVPQEVKEARLSICNACPLLHPITKTCASCGCFMSQKTKLPNASCPKHKWEAYVIDE